MRLPLANACKATCPVRVGSKYGRCRCSLDLANSLRVKKNPTGEPRVGNGHTHHPSLYAILTIKGMLRSNFCWRNCSPRGVSYLLRYVSKKSHLSTRCTYWR